MACLLTYQPDDTYSATPGTLTLAINKIQGTTNFDTGSTTVTDVTSSPSSPINATISSSSLSFPIAAGKKYSLILYFINDTNPDTVATLVEQPCGKPHEIVDGGSLRIGMAVHS